MNWSPLGFRAEGPEQPDSASSHFWKNRVQGPPCTATWSCHSKHGQASCWERPAPGCLHSTHTTPGETNEIDSRAPCGAVTPDFGVQAALRPHHRNAPLPSHH